MNKPYQSLALELYTKLPYELDKNIWIKIMKEVKKKELGYNELTNMCYSFNIFSQINKRSYNMYLLKKNFNKLKENLYLIRNLKQNNNMSGLIYIPLPIQPIREVRYVSRKLMKPLEDISLKY